MCVSESEMGCSLVGDSPGPLPHGGGKWLPRVCGTGLFYISGGVWGKPAAPQFVHACDHGVSS